jgi:hypothetical protein
MTESGGNIGIGTASPSASFHVQSASGSSIAETLAKFAVSDSANDYFSIFNGTAVNGQFVPSFRGHADSNGYGLYFIGEVNPSQDSGGGAVVTFDARRSNGALTSRRAFNFDSYGTNLMSIQANGSVGIGTSSPSAPLHVQAAAQSGTAETIAKFGVSDDPTSSISIINSGSTNGHFYPAMKWQTRDTDESYFIAQGSTDTGSNSIMVFDSRIGSTPAATRPLFDFRTFGNSVMQIKANGNVGVGTSNPTSKLTVAGNVTLTGAGNGIVFPDGTTLNSSSAARIRAITYLAGCDTCSALADTDDQRTIYVNLVGPMTINSVTCFSDSGTPIINLQRDDSTPANILTSDLSCSASGSSSVGIAGSESVLNLNDKLDFVMVTAGGAAKRVTVVVKATVN